MKIYFDGCAKTKGVHIKPNWRKRYSTLLCDKLGAEEYNIARSGGSNRRLVRNLLEHDLSNYDMFVIQMTKRERFETYNEESGEWSNVCTNKFSPYVGLEKDYVSSYQKYFMFYYDNIYSDKMGDMDERICFAAIKSILQNKKHVIIYTGPDYCNVPVDFTYIKGKNHKIKKFNEETHEKIYNDIIEHLQ
tara:strand:- start:272 stop:841 length:570 start_codon:yes stop_codon:yes gene_type:complete